MSLPVTKTASNEQSGNEGLFRGAVLHLGRYSRGVMGFLFWSRCGASTALWENGVFKVSVTRTGAVDAITSLPQVFPLM